MVKKLLPPSRAKRLLWLTVHFSVRMLSRYLDPWSRYGADVLIEYVDSLWHPKRQGGPRNGPSSSVGKPSSNGSDRSENRNSL